MSIVKGLVLVLEGALFGFARVADAATAVACCGLAPGGGTGVLSRARFACPVGWARGGAGARARPPDRVSRVGAVCVAACRLLLLVSIVVIKNDLEDFPQ